MRARGLTQTDHSTEQLVTTGLTDDTIDSLWEYRYRVRKWTVSGSFLFDNPFTPDQTANFTGTMYSTQDPDEATILGGAEPLVTVQAGAQWDEVVGDPWVFTGDVTAPGCTGDGTLTIGDIAILRPHIAVVPPSTRAQCAATWALNFVITLDDLSEYAFSIGTDEIGGGASTVTAELDGRVLTGDIEDVFGSVVVTATIDFTMLEWWEYSDGVAPVWNSATGAKLLPTYQNPM